MPEAARCCGMANLRYSLTAHSIQPLLCLLGARRRGWPFPRFSAGHGPLRGAYERHPACPQGRRRGPRRNVAHAPASAPSQAAAIVADDGAQCRKPGEFYSPCLTVAGLDHSSCDPTEAARLDEHQNRLGGKNLLCGQLGDLGLDHLVEHLEQLAGTFAGILGGPSQRRHTRDGHRPRHDLQQSPCHAQAAPSAWATLANSSCLSRVISTARSSRCWRSWF